MAERTAGGLSGYKNLGVEHRQTPHQLKREVDLRTILIECLSVGLRVTLMAFRLTVSMVIFQKPLLGTVIFAGKVSNAPP